MLFVTERAENKPSVSFVSFDGCHVTTPVSLLTVVKMHLVFLATQFNTVFLQLMIKNNVCMAFHSVQPLFLLWVRSTFTHNNVNCSGLSGNDVKDKQQREASDRRPGNILVQMP